MDLASLGADAYLAMSVVGMCFAALIITRFAADLILVAGLLVLLVFGVLDPEEAFSGFSNQGTLTVAFLFVVARGLAKTGAADWVASAVLGRSKSLPVAQARLMAPVAAMSSVVNNTPVVAMMIPAVMSWAKRYQFPVSQLLMPLSYAAIIGGACTLIGTSTNLVVDGLLKDFLGQQEMNGAEGLGIFDLALVGVPCVLVVLLYVLLFSRFLLPKGKNGDQTQFGDTRQYTVEMLVDNGSALAGKTIEEADLRSLPGVFLVEIERQGHLITAVGPQQILRAGDRLVFAGNVESIVDLQNMRGLRPADDQIFKINSERSDRNLVEVVISNSFPKLGTTVKEGKFRSTYGAAIIAVAREGQRIRGRIGDIVLKPGDTLLIEAGRSFERQQRYVKDFLMVRAIDYTPVSHERMGIAVTIFTAMIIAAATNLLSMLEASLLAAGLMVVSNCIRADEARNSLDWQILIVIGASIGLGMALEKTGAAASLAHGMLGIVSDSPGLILAALFFITAGLSAMVSNVAAAVIMFPIAAALSVELGLDVRPFAVTLMIAASASFATPIGYQTNLMVYGPGKYRFIDFIKMGAPLTILVGITTVLLVPIFWSY